ncbi:MAG: amidohydrolase [Phycisphaerales bacterium]|nr:amidohydrolase [Phycisphaerales bacterium]
MRSDFPDALQEDVDAALVGAHEEMVTFRRDLHAHPELAGEEHRTTDQIANRLQKAGLVLRDLPGTGVVADLLTGAPDDRWLALRADIDCVPVADEKDVPWRSTRDGRCHACGHDAHATMVLFVAEALARQRAGIEASKPAANLRFLFQPAEETATGAVELIEAGAVTDVQDLLALHCDPFLDVGQVAIRTGPITSNMRTFKITITGEGGHSARPHDVIDPVPAATNVVSMLYQLAPRSMDSRYPMCLTVTSITAGQAFNAIPGEAVICGTLRTGRAADDKRVRHAMERCIDGVCQATGCEFEIEYPYATPATNNHETCTALIEQSARRVLDPDGLLRMGLPSLGGEDFAYYQQVVPAAMAKIGTGSGPLEDRRPLHSPLFDIDESALPLGARLLAGAAILGLGPSHEAENHHN